MTTIETITTAEQLLAAGDIGRCELVRGELIMMSPTGSEHGWIETNVTVPLGAFVKRHALGRVFVGDTGFRIGRDPDTVRAPDVAFVAAARIGGKLERGFFPGAPDLAVEVLSPDDRPGEVTAKIRDWLDAGCRLVWVVDPRTRSVAVHRSGSEAVVLGESQTLDGGDLLPGFHLPVRELFE